MEETLSIGIRDFDYWNSSFSALRKALKELFKTRKCTPKTRQAKRVVTQHIISISERRNFLTTVLEKEPKQKENPDFNYSVFESMSYKTSTKWNL